MARERRSPSRQDSSDESGRKIDIEAALDAMNPNTLRGLVREMLDELDDRASGRIINNLIDRAALDGSGWSPAGPSANEIAEIVSSAEAARRIGSADPSEIDDYLRKGSNAFLGKDYAAAFKIFRALLIPISSADIHLGQHEMVDEVLNADLAICSARYVVSMYMTSAPVRRAEAVLKAVDEVRQIGLFWQPIREIERAAIEPLPELDEFLRRWRALIEERARTEQRHDWDTDEDRWLREVTERMEGAEGLAGIARSTKRGNDLRVWCRALIVSGDWRAALRAYEEAADIVTDKPNWRGEFLDGAALAAQELGRKDLPARLQHAWREAPTMIRLRRWLGSARSGAAVRECAAEALDLCPKSAHRQRALLYILLGDLESAARLLALAPGLGWSDNEHPGHLLSPIFHRLLVSEGMELPPEASSSPSRRMDIYDEIDIDDPGWMGAEPEEPRLALPKIAEILELAGVNGPSSDATRRVVINAMRKAAETRLVEVTKHKRRRHYDHSVQLVAAVVEVDPTRHTAAWAAKIRTKYRRYPALQRAFNEMMGPT